MWAMFSILWSYFRKSFHTIFFAFVFPIIMLVLIAAINDATSQGHGASGAQIAIPGLAIASASVIGIVTLSMTYCDFKQSIIIKRIGATPIKSWEFIFSLLVFHIILIFISNIWIFGFSIAVYHEKLVNLASVNWGYVILSILFASVICSAIGVIIGIIARDFKIANAFSLLLYLPTSFLTGQYIPYNLFKNSHTLVVLSKVFPFSYPVSIMNSAWNGAGSNMALFDNYWLPIVISAAWSIGLVGLAIIIYKFRRK